MAGFAALHPRYTPRGSVELQRFAVEILGSLDLNQHGEPGLVGIAVLLRLDQTLPYLLVDRSGSVDLGTPVEAGDPALRQNPLLPQLRLAEEHGEPRAVGQIGAG